MRRDRVTQLLIVAFGTAWILAAQTRIDLSRQSRRIDFSNSTGVKPIPVGAALPSTCSVGEMFFKTDTAAGENLYMCPAPDIWIQGASPLTMQAGPAGGILISNTAENFDVDADTMFLASQAGNNQFIGHNDFSGAASLRIATGPVEPAVAACDSASETGSIYVLTGDSTKASLLYVCQAIPEGYGWRPGTYAQDTAPPSTCVAGQVFFDTDAPAGENWLGCTSSNIWTLLGKQHSKGITPPVSCAVGDVFFDTDAPAGDNWLGCTSTDIWTVLGKQGQRGVTPPVSCAVGDVFFDTDAPAGENWLGCTSTNIWTMLGKQSQRGVTPPASCAVGDVFFDTDAPAGDNWLGCTSTDVWTTLGKQSQRGFTPPASCAVGDVFFDTDAPAGDNWLGCTSTDIWTTLGKQSQRGFTPPASCTVGDVFFDTDAPAGENWLGCTSTDIWTVLGKPAVSPSRLLTWQKQSPATVLSGSETVIASTVVPGGTIPSGACLKFRAGFQHTTGTASVEYRIRYGTSYLTALAPTTSAQIVRLEGFMCNDPAATGSQQIAAGYMLSTSNSSEQMTTMAVDSTLDQMFSLAAVGPVTDAITLRYFLVEVLK